MSTKSLDLSLPLHHRRQLSNELSSLQFTKDMKTKINPNKLQCYEELGAKLIEDRLLLSALELYAELGEAGHEINCLKQFFSNPGNFEKSAQAEASRFSLVRSLSQTTLDSLDFAPISEDGDRAGGDRVAILEFELRKAKETITALRENLTQQVELENASNKSESESTGSQSNCPAVTHHHHSTPEPMRGYEQRALNFLVHEYLLTHGYRLTSITFADENTEQDFEHWDDVGLNVERPADLLSMFRLRSKPAFPTVAQTEEAETQTEEQANENDSADLTMQFGISAEESGNDTQIAPSQTCKPANCATSVSLNVPQQPSSTLIQHPSGTTKQHPEIDQRQLQSTIAPNQALSTRPKVTPTLHPQPMTQLQRPDLQNSARALKDELQQGVEDVCQKLNSFFSKPPSLPGSSPRLQSTAPFSATKTPDRSAFSLFHNK